jgi:HK97 gp10 family phage protein
MADSVTIEVKGLIELQDNIKKLGAQLATKGIKQSVAAGAKVVKQQVIQNAPVRSGALKNAILVKGKKEKQTPTFFQYIVGVRRGRNKKTKQDAYYWWWVENGTSKMPAKPFLRPAFENKKFEAADKIKSSLLAFIDKYGNKK